MTGSTFEPPTAVSVLHCRTVGGRPSHESCCMGYSVILPQKETKPVGRGERVRALTGGVVVT